MTDINSYLVFDFETTGLDPWSDRIVQVGICRVENSEATECAAWLIYPGVSISPDATAVHGITDKDVLQRGIDPREGLHRLLDYMQDGVSCVGHNIHRFDVLFLLEECRRLGLSSPNCEQYVDTAALFKGMKLGMRKSLNESHRAYANRILSIRVKGLRYFVDTCIRELDIEHARGDFHQAGGFEPESPSEAVSLR